MTDRSPSALRTLRERIRALELGGAAPGRVLPLGLPAIDAVLPRGGLALGVLHEFRGAGADEEDAAAPAGFITLLLARLVAAAGAPVLWCLAAADLYAPGLEALGLPPAQLVVARARTDAEILWAMEEALRAPAFAAVVGEVGVLNATASRRLQLAAEASGVTALALRRWREGRLAARERQKSSAAATRWRVASMPGALADGEPGVGRARWQVELLHCRGGGAGTWIVEMTDAPGAVAVPAELSDRPDRAERASGTG